MTYLVPINGQKCVVHEGPQSMTFVIPPESSRSTLAIIENKVRTVAELTFKTTYQANVNPNIFLKVEGPNPLLEKTLMSLIADERFSYIRHIQ